MKLSLHSTFLLGFASLVLFTLADANANNVKNQVAVVTGHETGYDKIANNLSSILPFLKDENDPDLIDAAVQVTGILRDNAEEIIDAMNRVSKTSPADFQLTWWADDSDKSLRFLLILLQANAILGLYPDKATHIVHTSFCEDGLLQTYFLAATLAKMGYVNIQVNVIGHNILNVAARTFMQLDRNHHTLWGPGSKQKMDSVIKDKISEIFATINSVNPVKIVVYGTMEEYVEAVISGSEPRSNSFDMVRGDACIKPIEYRPRGNYKADLGRLSQYERIVIAAGKMVKIFGSKRFIPLAPLQTINISSAGSSRPPLEQIYIDDKGVSLSQEEVEDILRNREVWEKRESDEREKGHGDCMCIHLFPRKCHVVFQELMEATREERCPLVAFQLGDIFHSMNGGEYSQIWKYDNLEASATVDAESAK